MKCVVFGAGMMGSALAYDLAHSEGVACVILADRDVQRARNVAGAIGPKVMAQAADMTSYGEVVALLKTADVAAGATSYNHNYLITKAAIEAGTHFCDLGGNMEVVRRQLALDAPAREAGVLVVPNCGLAPGLACILAAGGARRFSSVQEIRLRVGGLPQHPRPPLNYQLVFSAEGLINEYLEPAQVIRRGELATVESMADVEEIEFPPPFGRLEAFNTSGGISMLPEMFRGKVDFLDYKTIRYTGHCEKFRMLLDLGFASAEPIMLGSTVRTARELFEELLRKKLPASGPDVVLLRVTVSGTMNGASRTLSFQLVDRHDDTTHITAMMRTTSFPTSVIAQMIARGTIAERGVLTPEQCVPLDPLIAELKKRNILITEGLS